MPTVEVGTASFACGLGSNNPDCTGNFSKVEVKDVKFFSTASGQKPLIWATANVSGTVTSTPTSTTLHATSGATGSVTFGKAYWDSNRWVAKVYTGSNESVTLQGSQDSIQMRGVAAGTITGNTFSGTAAGFAR